MLELHFRIKVRSEILRLWTPAVEMIDLWDIFVYCNPIYKATPILIVVHSESSSPSLPKHSRHNFSQKGEQAHFSVTSYMNLPLVSQMSEKPK
jgi:hypothetical protein